MNNLVLVKSARIFSFSTTFNGTHSFSSRFLQWLLHTPWRQRGISRLAAIPVNCRFTMVLLKTVYNCRTMVYCFSLAQGWWPFQHSN